MRSRADLIAEFYEQEAVGLFQAVHGTVRGPDALVEDACAFAWCCLVEATHVPPEQSSFGWLYVVALREAYRLCKKSRREPAFADPCALGDVHVPDVWHQVERALEVEHRRRLLGGLPPRCLRLIVLQSAGFSYNEIARITGDTPRTVDRQLRRGRRALRRLSRSVS